MPKTKQMKNAGPLQWPVFLGLVLTSMTVGCTTASQSTIPENASALELPITSQRSEPSQPSDPVSADNTAQPLLSSESENRVVQRASEQNRYRSDRFGFSFTYPDGFELTVTHSDNSTEEHVTLLRQEDMGDPEPPFIGISVSKNPQQLSLEDFREQKGYFIINEFPETTVAGQRALDFESAGLYESREHLFKTPEGTHVVSLSATYLDMISETDPFWQVAQTIRDSFEWRLFGDTSQAPTTMRSQQ